MWWQVEQSKRPVTWTGLLRNAPLISTVLIVTGGALTNAHRDLISALAARHRLPAVYPLPLLRRRWRPDLIWA